VARPMATRPRVVVASPDRLECTTIADWLTSESLEPIRRWTPEAALDEIRTRPYDLLVADAAFAFDHGLHAASRARKLQTPTVVLGTDASADRTASLEQQLVHLTRPVDRPLLVCMVSMALADGRPPRRSPRKSVHRFAALVNGAPSYIVDVSNEGLRLELPRERRAMPAPYFNVVVPLIGVGVTVQRMWTRTSPDDDQAWCGAALLQNGRRAASAWLAFVDTVPIVGAPSADSLHIQ
jgi:hypothetical protein